MLELISTIATATQAMIAWFNYTDGQSSLINTKVSKYRHPRDSQNLMRLKVENVFNKLWGSQRTIEYIIIIVVVIWVLIALAVHLVLEFQFLPYRYSANFGIWLLTFLLVAAVLSVPMYGILLGIGKFYIGNILEYFEVRGETLFHLKVFIDQCNWQSKIAEWFIKQTLLEIQK